MNRPAPQYAGALLHPDKTATWCVYYLFATEHWTDRAGLAFIHRRCADVIEETERVWRRTGTMWGWSVYAGSVGYLDRAHRRGCFYVELGTNSCRESEALARVLEKAARKGTAR